MSGGASTNEMRCSAHYVTSFQCLLHSLEGHGSRAHKTNKARIAKINTPWKKKQNGEKSVTANMKHT